MIMNNNAKQLHIVTANSGPIRIAQIMGKLWAGGVEAVVFNYYREIDKTKVQFDFYYDADSTIEPPQELIDMGARFYKIPPYQKLPAYLKTLKKYFRKNNYQIVHSHINTLSVFPLYAAWSEGIPIRIAHNHSVPGGNEFKRNLIKQLLRRLSKIFSTHYFACSEKAGRWLFGDKTFSNGKVYIVKNAIDFDKFTPKKYEIDKLKNILHIENNAFIVGHIGRFTFAKNHQKLLEIFTELSKIKPEALLLLVGDGELRKKIEDKVKILGIKDKVIFIGQVSNPEKYYGLANVIVLPSIFEGLSLTAIESQVAGIPVVASKAIPDEAVISNGLYYVDIEEDNIVWINKIIKSSKRNVKLDCRANDYNIKNRALLLCQWYLEHKKSRD